MNPHEIISRADQTASFIASSVSKEPTGEHLRDRARGVLLGLAAGNLLGLDVEGASYNRIAAWYPNGLTEIDPNEASRHMDDDLAQAVDLGHALLAGGDYTRDFADRLVTWAHENGRGIGITTSEVIDVLATGLPLPEPARLVFERRNSIAPNGGVMRCAPVAIARRRHLDLLVADSAMTCAVTHYALTCQWSCILINATIAALINGAAPDLPGLLAAARADGCPDLAAVAQADGIPADALLVAVDRRLQPPPDTGWLMRDHRLIGHTLLATQFGLSPGPLRLPSVSRTPWSRPSLPVATRTLTPQSLGPCSERVTAPQASPNVGLPASPNANASQGWPTSCWLCPKPNRNIGPVHPGCGSARPRSGRCAPVPDGSSARPPV